MKFNEIIPDEEQLIKHLIKLRETQKQFFKTKSHLHLMAAKKMESELDNLLKLNLYYKNPVPENLLFDDDQVGYHGSLKNETLNRFF